MTKKEILKALSKVPDNTEFQVQIGSKDPNDIQMDVIAYVKRVRFSTKFKSTKKGLVPIIIATFVGEV